MKTNTIIFAIILFLSLFCFAQFSSNPDPLCGGEANNFVVTKIDNNSSYDIVYDREWHNDIPFSHSYTTVLLNNGSGQFSNYYYIDTESSPGYVYLGNDLAVGNLNDDGWDDLALGKTYVYSNTNYAFSSTSNQTITQDGEVFWGNYDGDNDDDLVIGGDGYLKLYNNDDGIINTSAIWSVSKSNIERVYLSNVGYNNKNDPGRDKKEDLFIISGGDIQIFISTGYSFPSSPSQTLAGDYEDLAIGDVNHDEYNDLVAVYDDGVKLFLNTQNNQFNSSPVWSKTWDDYTRSVTLSDINYDGWDDVVISGLSGVTKVFYNTKSSPYFSTSPSWESDAFTSYGNARDLVCEDIHGTGGKSIILNQPGDGLYSFTPTTLDPAPAPPKHMYLDTYNSRARVKWSSNEELDLAYYKVYRKIVPSNPKPLWTYLASTTNTYYVDTGFGPDQFGKATAYYRVVAVDNTSHVSAYSDIVSTDGWIILSRPNQEPSNNLQSTTPSEFMLMQNFPNPFNPITTISYDISEKSFVKIEIVDISGKIIEPLVCQNQEPGHYNVTWDASGHAAGVYLYRIATGQFVDVKKCILLK